MLDLNITIKGDKVIIEGLNKLASEMPRAIDRALERIAKGIHREASDWLRGPGGASKKVRRDYVGFTKAGKTHASGTYSTGEDVMFRSYKGAGGYPVPIRTKNLLNLLDWLHPGTSKTGDAGTFSAGPHEVVVYDSAKYANTIHEGKGSSAKFGRRPFLTDALKIFNGANRIENIIEEEIQKEINKNFK